MSTQFGPLDEYEHNSGITSWLADTMIVGTARLFTRFLDGSVRYTPAQNRLSLHGESEHAAEGFAAGMMTTTVFVSAALLSVLPVFVLAEGVEAVEGALLGLTAALTLAGIGLITINVSHKIIDRLNSIEVYDHRTAAHDDERLGELQAGYARGDLDRDEFEREVETVVEREVGR